MRHLWLTGLVAVSLLSACERDLVLDGQRLDLRGEPVAAAEPADDAGAWPISLPPARAATDWPQRAGGAANDPGHRALAAAPGLRWQVSIGQGNDRRHRITAAPVVADGRVFTVDSRATVTAHSTGGQPLWRVDLTPAYEDPDDASGAGLAVAGGRLFVTSGFGFMAALDTADGSEIWRQQFDAAASGAPTVAGDTVYAVTRDSRAWALDTAQGRVRWTVYGTQSPAGVMGAAAPAVSGGTIVFPFASTELIATDAEGAPQWTKVVGGQREGRAYGRITDITGDPVVRDGTVYAGNASGRMAALDLATGEQRWFAADGAASAAVVAGGSVFAVTDKNALVRLDATTGARIWSVELPLFVNADRARRRKEIYAHFGPVLAGGRVWLASSDGLLRAYDPVDGTVVQTVRLPRGATTAPVVADNTLYVVTETAQLVAFR